MHYSALFKGDRGFKFNKELCYINIVWPHTVPIFGGTWVKRKEELISLVKYNVSFNILDYQNVDG